MAFSSQMYLFKDRRFLPMLITQACGCFNDNLLKSALIMIITYKASIHTTLAPQFLIAIANAIFILPFVLLAGIAGQIADKYDKARVVQIIKALEIGIVILSIQGFWTSNLITLFAAISLMGMHSTFFGPIKYSILPEHLKKDELIAANGYIEATTFITILVGTLLGGFAVSGVYAILCLMMLMAIVGFITSMYILPSTTISSDIKLNPNIFQESWLIVKYSTSKKQVFLSILGISWFWFIGAAIMSQIPTLTKDVFACDQTVANLFLGVFSVGVGAGSFICNRIFGQEISTKYVFISAIGISIFGADLFFASRISAVEYPMDQLRDVVTFLGKKHNWRILVDLFFIAALGGLYIVPLYAAIQYFSAPAFRSRVIAANNVVNAVFMIASSILISILFNVGCSVTMVIFIISLLNAIVAIYIYQLLPENEIIPEPILRKIIKFIFDKLYRVEIKGEENFQKAGKRAVIVSNHISYLDPAMLAVYSPERLIFAVNTHIAQEWWLKPFLKIVKAYPVDSNNPMAMKNIINEVRKNKKIAIFPEGRISTTGALMKIYEGPGMIADKAEACILPIRIDGLQFTIFSKMKHLARNRAFPKVTITILPPVRLEAPNNLDSRERRKFLSQKLYDIMSEMIFESSDYRKTIFQSLIDAGRTYGFNYPIIMDLENNSITYRSLITKSFILGSLFAKHTQLGENVGLMLPNSCGTVISFFGLQAHARITTMINFTSGAANIVSACKTACIKTVFTSRKFIKKAELFDVVEALSSEVKILYLEDLKDNLSIISKLKGIIGGFLPETYYNYVCKNQDKNSPAIILFTSGTEGIPKAVAISHKNMQANRCQMSARVDFGLNDVAFNALPLFHCFGLMAGCMLTVLGGVRTFYYPSPLHYRIIPEVIYDIGTTIMFGTDTFLNGYAKFADPYDFYSIRYTFAGAERLKPETRKLWFDKFGVRIFEGYGVTEASPVIAVNTPMHDKPGTVGRLIPKMESAILPVEGITEGGRLCVKGPNIMLGYINSDNPGVIIPPSIDILGSGWYDTGDIVSIDSEGYIKILGRSKRFAKIAGEMISLATIEEIASQIDPKVLHASVCVQDEKKGEQIILFTESKKISRDSFLSQVKLAQKTELLIPRIIKILPEIPILSTGKINYRKIVEMAQQLAQEETNGKSISI